MKTYTLFQSFKPILVLILFFLTLGAETISGETQTFTFTGSSAATALGVTAPVSTSSGTSITGQSITQTPITISFAKGDGSSDPKFYHTTTNGIYQVRMYNGNSITISAASGYVINSIVATGSGIASSDYWNSNDGTLSGSVSSASLTTKTFRCTQSTVKINSISVTYSSSCTAINPTVTYSATILYKGETASVSNITGNTGGAAVTYSSSNAAVASVNPSTGVVTAGQAGTATITASFAATGDYCAKDVTIPFEVRYRVKWSVNGDDTYNTGSPTSYIGTHNTKVSALPTSPTSAMCDGSKVFVGWTTSSYSHASTAPATLFTTVSGAPKVTDHTTYYAVFATRTGGAATWDKVTTLAGITEGTYVIINNGKYLPNTTTSSSPTQAAAPTITGTQITGTVTDVMKWYFTSTNITNRFYIQNADDKYLYENNSTTGLRVGDNTDSWTFAANTLPAFSMVGTNNSRYCATYASGSDWRSYDSSTHANYGDGGKIYLYKLNGGYTYSNYETTCCTPLGQINGSINWSNGTQATLSWDDIANVASWAVTAIDNTTSSAVAAGNITTPNDDGDTYSCVVSNLTAGHNYTFTIAATAASGYCDNSQEITATAPLITASGTIDGLNYAEGSGPSTAKTFTVSGVGLTGDITVTAPTNFEVSKSSGSGYGSSVSFSPTSGTLASSTVYVRLATGKSVGTYGPSAITISGGGAANNTGVTIAGSVSSACTKPTVATPTLTSIASGTITVSCASVTVDENCDVTDYGFVWNESSDPTISDNKTPVGSSTPASGFNDNLSISFTTGTTYKIKAYAINSAGTTLSATLSVTPQSVTFVSNGGSSVATAYVNNGGTVSKPSNPTLANYDFDNWYTDDKTFESAADFSSAITEDKTYYANWTETLHDVTVEYKCGSTTVKAFTTIENVGVVTTGSTTAPNDITGYTWSTWSAMPSGVTTSTTPLTTRTIIINATANDKTITANYTANQYAITYKDEGDAAYSGNNEGSLPSIHTYGSATALIDGTKTGYDFVGWFTDAACTESAGGSIGATAKTAAFTLYAKWTAKEYDVTLKANGGTSSDQVVSATYDAAMPATVKAGTGIVAPTYNGYTFGGYYDNADYTKGTQYYTDALASAHNWDKASTANLYGRWTPNEYVVTLDANGGVDGVTTSVTTTFGAAMPTIASANLPTRAGYRFDGFYTESGTKYYKADGTSAKNQARFSAGQVLYAHWVAQLTFSVNGVVDGTLTRDDNTAMPTSATVPASCGDCWAFMGWSTNSSESGAPAYAGGDTHEFESPTTLYAVFGKTEYKMINSTSDLVANDNYILTFYYDDTDHEYALSNEKKYTHDAAVTDVTSLVRENGEGWFIYNIGANNIWKFTGTKDAGQLYNAASGKYVNLSSTSSDLLNTTDNLTFTNDGIFWTIKSTNYLNPYSYSSYEINSSEPSYSAFLYHQISAEYATMPGCETYDIVWKVDGTPLASGSQTEETNTCAGIEELPTDPDDDELDCATKFMGWSESTLIGTGKSAPADLFTDAADAPAINEDKTFHAVFATTIGTTIAPIEDSDFSGAGEKDEEGTYCGMSFKLKTVGKYLRKQSIWTSSDMTNVKVRIRVYHVSNSTADVLRVSLIDSDGNEVVGADLTTTKYGTGSSSAGYSDYVELTPTAAVTGYKVSMKTNNSYGTGINKIEREVIASGIKDYMTSCCDELVTLTTNSPENGTISFSPASPIATCDANKTVTMTITPSAGYKLYDWAVATGDGKVPASSTEPAVVTGEDNSDAQVIMLTFNQHLSGDYAVSATFEQMHDEYFDYMHDNAKVGGNRTGAYSAPSRDSKTAASGEDCKTNHYKFKGWVVQEEINDDGTLKDGYTLITAGSSMTASNKIYYAVWAKEE